MSRVVLDSSLYHEAKQRFDGRCLNCGKDLGLSDNRLRSIKLNGWTSRMVCQGNGCYEAFIEKTIRSWSATREAAFKRDDYTCQDCHTRYEKRVIEQYVPDDLPTLSELEDNPGKVESKLGAAKFRLQRWEIEEQIPLEGHHVIPISEGGDEFDVNNVITLCQKCHDLRHSHFVNIQRRQKLSTLDRWIVREGLL